MLVAALASLCAPAAAAPVSCQDEDVYVADERATQSVECLVDRERATRGLPRLVHDDRLAAAAQRFAEHLQARGGMVTEESHAGEPPDARATPQERLAEQGYDAAMEGEVLGNAQATPRQVVEDWMRSRGHCRTLLLATAPGGPASSPVHIGVGRAGVGTGSYWVALVARPAGTPDPGSPGYVPACPVAGAAPESADVVPFQPASAAPGARTSAPGGHGLVFVPQPEEPLRAGTSRRLYLLAPRTAALRATVRDGAGTRELGRPRRVHDGEDGMRLWALPFVRVLTAATVTVTDGAATVEQQLVPSAYLHRAVRRAGPRRVRVTGSLRPELAGQVIRIGVRRGGRVRTAVVRTTERGRFAATVGLPSRRGSEVVVRVVAPAAPGLYAAGSATPRYLLLDP
ncbi:MAG TPA: CAP domain-containing protein [Baekduia sp.]|nr:CAP domain-containing protein [Baekduia sp.]